ncbi:PilC/PilY family type IV pilus protein [bacterium]|nr:PilC/PilY family type IV pilus protein [bacterium]
MNAYYSRILTALLLLFSVGGIQAEDIDLFASGYSSQGGADSRPNVIFVLDNTANWSRTFDGGMKYGAAEIEAIQNTLSGLEPGSVNVSVMEFGVGSAGNSNGGFVRWHLQPYDATTASSLNALLDSMKTSSALTSEKINQESYGNLISDVYNYLAGINHSMDAVGLTNNTDSLADSNAYITEYSLFNSPLGSGDVCAETYVIFVANPTGNSPKTDSVGSAYPSTDALESRYAEVGLAAPYGLSGDSDQGLLMPAYEGSSGGNNNAQEEIAQSQQCYASSTDCTDNINGNGGEAQLIIDSCPSGGSCVCSASNGDRERGDCPTITETYLDNRGRTRTRQVQTYTRLVLGPAAASDYGPTQGTVDGKAYNLDDWTKFMHEFGIPLTVSAEGAEDFTLRIPVTTYTIDVFPEGGGVELYSSLLDSAAQQGGGYRLEANTVGELSTAMSKIFGDIIDVSSSFAAVTLPLSANNNTQSQNKVFVGMFRPAAERKPRWMGNLKQYQLALFNGQVELADVDLNRAINPQTGFVQSCATSFWTEDTSDVDPNVGGDQPYFDGLGLDPNPVSECNADFLDGRQVLSDSPDGAFIEKGGAAQQIRNQVSGSTVNRTIYEASGSSLTSFSVEDVIDNYFVGTNPGLKGGDFLVDDGNGNLVSNSDLGEGEIMPANGLRPTIHGDVVHSRPLTLSYDDDSFLVLYGANDGLYRAVDPATGLEQWAFVASSHLSKIERLYRNTPTIAYAGLDSSLSSDIEAVPKDYFFDGSTGAHTVYNNANQLETAYIYPTMRRGGREVYAFDMSPTTLGEAPSAPQSILWKLGCPSVDSDTGCTTGFTNMGQTWSTPVIKTVKGYQNNGVPAPVLFMGGGWDSCLDTDNQNYSCSNPKGNSIYAIDAVSGDLLKEFPTEGPVVAELAAVDLDADGHVDLLYAADASGKVYRISVAELASESVSVPTEIACAYGGPCSNWYIRELATTGGSDSSERRFINKPEVAELGNLVFVTLGSGDREKPLTANYPYTADVQNRFYAVIDQPFPRDADESGSISANEQNLTWPAVNLDGGSAAGMLDAEIGLADDQIITDFAGWYLDLSDTGEQIVNRAAISGGTVFFNSFQPEGGRDGLCSNLGTSKAYSIPLFTPEVSDDDGVDFGQGIPIPPIIVTVDLSSGDVTCPNVDGCGEGEITADIVTICIGCEGFDPIIVEPVLDATRKESFRVENIDVQ